MALTPKQQRFVEEYLIDRNATQAAIRAGYSQKTAYAIGNENLNKPEIAKAIREAIENLSERTRITQDRVLEEIASNAFKYASDLQESEMKHSSKAKYLDMLCKCLGMYDKQDARAAEQEVEDDPLTKALKEEAEMMQDANQ